MATQIKLLPIVVRGTGYSIEPLDGKFVTGLDKTWLQSMYQDSLNPDLPQVLPPYLVRQSWEYLKNGDPDPELFYDEQLHKPYGAEAGDLKPMLKWLAEEMHHCYLFVNGVFVVDNKNGLVLNLGNTQLPAFITPVGVYTEKPVTPKSEHGMSLNEFKRASGRLVAYKAFPAGRYQLSGCEGIPNRIEPVGLMETDEIHVNLNSKHSDSARALGWFLHRPDKGQSNSLVDGRLDYWYSGGGVLRGRRYHNNRFLSE